MSIVKVSDGKYINVDRVTFVEPKRRGQLVVHVSVAGGDWVDSSCTLKLEQEEAAIFLRWLDGHSQDVRP